MVAEEAQESVEARVSNHYEPKGRLRSNVATTKKLVTPRRLSRTIAPPLAKSKALPNQVLPRETLRSISYAPTVIPVAPEVFSSPTKRPISEPCGTQLRQVSLATICGEDSWLFIALRCSCRDLHFTPTTARGDLKRSDEKSMTNIGRNLQVGKSYPAIQ